MKKEIEAEKMYLEMFDLIFFDVHSDGFKISEMKSLLYLDNYWFMNRKKDNWKELLKEYLTNKNIDYSEFKGLSSNSNKPFTFGNR